MSKEFSGIITKVSPDGRTGVVTLDPKTYDKKFAVISPDTKGRIKLMNGVGQLTEQTKVTGMAEKGPDSLHIISVRLAS